MKAKNTKRAVIIAILMLCQLAVSSLAAFVSPLFDGYIKVLAVKLIYAVSFLIPCFLWNRAFKPVGDDCSNPSWCEYRLPAFFIAFAAIVACLQVNVVLLELFPYEKAASGGFMPDGFWGFVFSLLMYAVIPAITEELFFRGVILRVAGSGFWAVALSGALFGLCHFNPSQLVYSVGSGIVLALLCLYTSNIKLPVLLHLCVNVTVLVLSYASRALEVGVYVAVECILWLLILGVGIYFCYVILRDYQIQINERTKDIKNIKADISRAELISPAMLIVYVAIILATVLRLI